MTTRASLILICLLFVLGAGYSQNSSVQGNVADTSSAASLHQATVYLLRASDSILVAYTRCDEKGHFFISGLRHDKYLLYIKYPGYAEYRDTINLPAQTGLKLGAINLRNKIKVLEEVIVRQKIAAIRLKGDTTEYKADSFYVPPNATVQDLLKKLPGIQVNGRGEIFAIDARVEKVLVDGEEFFSDDPAVVIQNLRADYIDKVQVYDNKSDQAKFTGIDDGKKIKTINLKLKEEKKLSYFGKAEAGSNFGKYYFGKAMINSFNKRSKMAAYITKDNTHYQALNFNEQNNFSTNLNMTTELRDDGSMSIQASSDEFGWGRGFPNSITGGLVYNTRLNNDALKLSNTYQYNNLTIEGNMATSSKAILPGLIYNTDQQRNTRSNKIRHLLNADYQWQADSTTTIKLMARGSRITHNDFSDFAQNTITSENIPLNQNSGNNSSSGDKNIVKTSFLLQKRLQKKGRTISIAADMNFNRQGSDNYLQSFSRFYSPAGIVIDSLRLDQYKPLSVNENKEGIKLTYTEPLSRKAYLEIACLLTLNQNVSSKKSYNKNGAHYDYFIDSLSSHFRYNNTQQAGEVKIKINLDKYHITFGSAAGISNYYLKDLLLPNEINRRFFAIMPTASFEFNKNRNTSLKLGYDGYTFNPSILEIQPLRDNSNPLDIIIGNENLQQAYVNNINLEYSAFKIAGAKLLMAKAFYKGIKNDFSNSSFTDSQGRRVTYAINVSGNYTAGLDLFYSFGIGKGVQWSVAINTGASQFLNIVNDVRNKTRSRRMGFETGIQKYNGTKTSFNINIRPVYIAASSSVETNTRSRFWSFESNPAFDIRLPGKLFFSANGELYLYDKSRFNTPDNIYLVNCSLKKFFSKADKWMLMASVNDVFNKNAAVDRSLSTNFIAQTVYTNIRRYFMLTIAYNFNKNFQPK